MSQVINLTAGAIEYTWDTTITASDDISSDTVTMCLGGYDEPSTFIVPDVITHPTPTTAVVKLLVGGDFVPASGTYWLWVKVTDSPEVIPRRGSRVTIVGAPPSTPPSGAGYGFGVYGAGNYSN